MHPSNFNGRIDQLKSPLRRRRLICEKDTHTCSQNQVLLFALVFLLVIVRGRTMGKLVSIVTTCLVVLSSRFYFWKNCVGRRIPRRTIMGTTDRRGCLVPKHIEFRNLGTVMDSLNFTTEWKDGPSFARRTITNLST